MSSITEKRSLRWVAFFVLSVIFLGLFMGSPAYAQTDYYWIGTSGDWSDPLSWNPTGPPQGGSYPNYSNVYLTQSDSTNRTVTLSTSGGTFNGLTVDATGTGTMTLSVSDGGGVIGWYLPGILVGNNGTGIVNQTGGIITSPVYSGPGGLALGVNPGSSGTYNLSGGSLEMPTLGVGVQGTGTFNQTGGQVTLDAGPGVGPHGTYNLSGTGFIDAIYGATISGTFNQQGGGFVFEDGGGIGIQRSGIYNLSGGTLQAGGGGMTNYGTFNYSGGLIQAFPPNFSVYTVLTNYGVTNVTGTGTRTVDGEVVNNGTFKVTNTTAVYAGTFTNNGAYISDPGKNYFTTLTVNSTGYLVGGAGDEFHFSGDFLNHSQNPLWNTAMADLFFGPGTHTFFLGDAGSSFTWDDMTLDPGAIIDFEGDATLHVKELRLFDFSQLTGVGQFFYDSLVFESVPEPSSLLLVCSALIGLVGFRRKFKGVDL